MQGNKLFITATFIVFSVVIIMILGIGFLGKKKPESQEPQPSASDAGRQIDKPLKTEEIRDNTAISTYDESLIEDTVDYRIEMTDKEWSEIPEDEKYEDPKGDAAWTWDPESEVPPTKKQALDTVYKKVTDAADGAGVFEFIPEVKGEPEKNDMGGFTCTVANQCGTTEFIMETDKDGKIYTTLKGSIHHEHFPGIIYNTEDIGEAERCGEYGEAIEKALIDSLFIRHVLKVDTVDSSGACLHDVNGKPYHIVFNGSGSGKLFQVDDKGEDVGLQEDIDIEVQEIGTDNP